METITLGKYTFKVVDHRPIGYKIWNIGHNMIPGYLPFCRLKNPQPFPGGQSIETDTLRAMKCDEAQTILAAIGYGPETPEQMEQYIKRNKNKYPEICARMKTALEPFKKVWATA